MEYTCTICCENLEVADDKPVSTPCGHAFHEKCLKFWLRNAFKCPLCNGQTRLENIRYLYLSSQSNTTADRSLLRESLKEALERQKQTQLDLKQSQQALKNTQKSLKDSKKATNDALVVTKYLQSEIARITLSVHDLNVTKGKYTELLIKSSIQEREKKQQALTINQKDASIKEKTEQLKACETELIKCQEKIKEQEAETRRLERELDTVIRKIAVDYYDILEIQNDVVIITNTTPDLNGTQILQQNHEANRKMDFFSLIFD